MMEAMVNGTPSAAVAPAADVEMEATAPPSPEEPVAVPARGPEGSSALENGQATARPVTDFAAAAQSTQTQTTTSKEEGTAPVGAMAPEAAATSSTDAAKSEESSPTAIGETVAKIEQADGKRKELPEDATTPAATAVTAAAPPSPPTKKQRVEDPAPPASAAPTESSTAPLVPTPTSTTTPATPVSEAGGAALQLTSAPIMISRDDMAKMEEDGGMLKFDVITNDGLPEHMVQLTTLKNIFARQLPKMPREYIVRLVFDRNHRSMIILKNGKHVIGGICYRPFEPNHFAEIAFCAINAADQVKGYGTRLMNHLKEYVKTTGITHFLTYADNYAIGYFKKQGFTKVVSMPRSNWFGFIKDYDGGTLMECTIHHQINYRRITSMVHQQRKKIQEKIKERSHADVVYPGLTKFAEGRTMDLYMIPGVKEAGWSQAVIRNSRVGTRDPGSLKSQLQQLLKHVTNHRSAWPFHEPVDTTVVVDYLDYIKEPVDLSLVQKRIESGYYISKAAFRADLDKMCENCMIYNTADTNYYKAAKDLQEFISKRVQIGSK